MQHKETLGEQVRRIADQLKQDTDLQIKATSRVLGAAAQIAENHDRLIHEVVDVVEGDLDQQARVYQTNAYTVDILRQQFRTLREAKTHFDLKASSWAVLVSKLNNPAIKKLTPTDHSKSLAPDRLDTIESELKFIRAAVNQILSLLKQPHFHAVTTSTGESMRTRIVRIGNFQGVYIPKALLEQSGLDEEVELEVQEHYITIRPANRPRQGWEAVFQEIAEQGDDVLLDPDAEHHNSWQPLFTSLDQFSGDCLKEREQPS